MEILTQNQELLLNIFKAVMFTGSLILVTIMAAYNWLFLSRILRSNHKKGLHPPKHLHHLVRTSIFIPFFTAIFIIIFLITGFY
jgi:heme/copper-type cytochrome/quinol oxidase subunit 2